MKTTFCIEIYFCRLQCATTVELTFNIFHKLPGSCHVVIFDG